MAVSEFQWFLYWTKIVPRAACRFPLPSKGFSSLLSHVQPKGLPSAEIYEKYVSNQIVKCLLKQLTRSFLRLRSSKSSGTSSLYLVYFCMCLSLRLERHYVMLPLYLSSSADSFELICFMLKM